MTGGGWIDVQIHFSGFSTSFPNGQAIGREPGTESRHARGKGPGVPGALHHVMVRRIERRAMAPADA